MASTAAGRPPAIMEVELHGIEPIPDEDRTASPLDLFRLEFGGANTFATVVLGAFPILVFPEPRALYGPEGPRWFPASDAAIPPIEARMRPAAGNPEADSPETGNTEVPVAGSSA